MATKRTGSGLYSQGVEYVDQNALDEWRIKVKSLLVNSCGKESEHYSGFVEGEKFMHMNQISLFLNALRLFLTLLVKISKVDI